MRNQVTYSLGDFFVSLSTVQNETKDDEEQNVNSRGFGGGFGGFGGGYYNQFNSRPNPQKLTKSIQIPRHSDRVKQVYHYRISKLLTTHKKTSEHVLDHMLRCDGKEHQLYVYLCKKLRVKPRFAFPIPIRKQRSGVRDKRSKPALERRETDDYYGFRKEEDNDGDVVLTDDAESESDCELPADPPNVIYPTKPKISEKYSATEFLSEFVKKCKCNVDAQVKIPKSYIERQEREKDAVAPKSDADMVKMSAMERRTYLERVKNHRRKLWDVKAPWHREALYELQFCGYRFGLYVLSCLLIYDSTQIDVIPRW